MSETILKVEDLKTSFMTSSGEVQAAVSYTHLRAHET